jgi:hypothetical protein
LTLSGPPAKTGDIHINNNSAGMNGCFTNFILFSQCNCHKQASLTMSAVSSMLRQHFPMHSNKSAISL